MEIQIIGQSFKKKDTDKKRFKKLRKKNRKNSNTEKSRIILFLGKNHNSPPHLTGI